MTKIHFNNIMYYGCIVKNKILRKHFIFSFVFCFFFCFLGHPLCYTLNTAVSCKYFIGKIFYGYTKMYILVMITTQLCCMETNMNHDLSLYCFPDKFIYSRQFQVKSHSVKPHPPPFLSSLYLPNFEFW